MNALIETKNTPLTEDQAIQVLFKAWNSLFSENPGFSCLCILLSHTALETGHFSKIKNYNWGNIKKTIDHDYCLYPCGEYLNGKYQMFYPPHPQCEFNSYPSVEAGAKEYIQFLMKEKYSSAWQKLMDGYAEDYCKELKKAGYFTAKLEDYLVPFMKLYQINLNKYSGWYSIKIKEFKNEEINPELNEIFSTKENKTVNSKSKWSLLFLFFFKISQFFFLLFYNHNSKLS